MVCCCKCSRFYEVTLKHFDYVVSTFDIVVSCEFTSSFPLAWFLINVDML